MASEKSRHIPLASNMTPEELLILLDNCNLLQLGLQWTINLLQDISARFEKTTELGQLAKENQGPSHYIHICEGSLLLKKFGEWCAKQQQPLLELATPSVLATCLTKTIDKGFQLGHALLFDRRFFDILGPDKFQPCCSATKSFVNLMTNFSTSVLTSWGLGLLRVPADSRPSKMTDVDTKACRGYAAALTRGLLIMSVTAAEIIFSSSNKGPAAVNAEANVGLGVVNCAVKCLSGLLKDMSELPEELRLIDETLIIKSLEALLTFLGFSVRSFILAPSEPGKLKLVRFWMMHLTVVAVTHIPQLSKCWLQLSRVTLQVFCSINRCELDSCNKHTTQVASSSLSLDLERSCKDKLVQLMIACLSEEGQQRQGSSAEGVEEALEARLIQLLDAANDGSKSGLLSVIAATPSLDIQNPEPSKACGAPGSSVMSAATQQQQPHFHLVSSILKDICLLPPHSRCRVAVSKHLLPWILDQAVFLESVSASTNAASGIIQPGSPLFTAATAILLFLIDCRSKSQATGDALAKKSWQSGCSQLYIKGCSTQPFLHYLATLILSNIISKLSEEESLKHLIDLGKAIQDMAVAEAAIAVGNGTIHSISHNHTESAPQPCQDTGTKAAEEATASTWTYTASMETTLFSAAPPANLQSRACCASQLLSALLQAVPRAVAMQALSASGLDISESSIMLTYMADIASSAGTGMLINAFSVLDSFDCSGLAIIWLQSLGLRSAQLSEEMDHHQVSAHGCQQDASSTELAGGRFNAGLSGAPMLHACYVLSSYHLAAVFMALEAAIRWAINIIRASEGSDVSAALGTAINKACHIAAQTLHKAFSLQLDHPHVLPHTVSVLRIMAMGGSYMSERDLTGVVQHLSVLLKVPSCTCYVATVASHMGCLNPLPVVSASHMGCLNPLPVDLFRALFEIPDPFVKHEVLLAAVSVSRTCAQQDLKALIPQGLLEPRDNSTPSQLSCLFRSYLTRKASYAAQTKPSPQLQPYLPQLSGRFQERKVSHLHNEADLNMKQALGLLNALVVKETHQDMDGVKTSLSISMFLQCQQKVETVCAAVQSMECQIKALLESLQSAELSADQATQLRIEISGLVIKIQSLLRSARSLT
ncbi:hypothetical protein CEUSTIGMA_g1954.t1 [Chlamydomonas eustigma]|uniref:Uncharacterized protein n=1 Tax=Chlamydomonas eustigma TaxID=1157962 RepID=A0A250WUM6_9CHLO|nr:hypothetical protein CEUSTIGMA_g1954.t1 [Chlamydomonas eustigma]|eukprot:GAX74505.1 hypothetical protein CEUSTIGMA_g1954.t1 [Chlamydomonas eustigma]